MHGRAVDVCLADAHVLEEVADEHGIAAHGAGLADSVLEQVTSEHSRVVDVGQIDNFQGASLVFRFLWPAAVFLTAPIRICVYARYFCTP